MRIAATRHGQQAADTRHAARAGKVWPSSNAARGFQNRVPKWYTGSVEEFMAALALMEAGKMPRPALEEMARYDSLILSAEPEVEVVEEDEEVAYEVAVLE